MEGKTFPKRWNQYCWRGMLQFEVDKDNLYKWLIGCQFSNFIIILAKNIYRVCLADNVTAFRFIPLITDFSWFTKYHNSMVTTTDASSSLLILKVQNASNLMITKALTWLLYCHKLKFKIGLKKDLIYFEHS